MWHLKPSAGVSSSSFIKASMPSPDTLLVWVMGWGWGVPGNTTELRQLRSVGLDTPQIRIGIIALLCSNKAAIKASHFTSLNLGLFI